MYHEVLNIVCFQTFSVKHKENYLHRKYKLLGVLQKICLLQFHRQNKIDDCISFTKLWSRASQAAFSKFKKNTIQKNILNNFFLLFMFLFIFFNVLYFFYWKQIEKKYACLCVGHSIPYKMMFVLTIFVKNCGRRQISCRKSVTFQEKGKIQQY